MNVTLYVRTFNFHKVVQQQNSGAVKDFILSYSAVYLQIQKVKELLKSVHICQSYRKNKSGTFFNGPRCRIPYLLTFYSHKHSLHLDVIKDPPFQSVSTYPAP